LYTYFIILNLSCAKHFSLNAQIKESMGKASCDENTEADICMVRYNI